MHQLAAYGIVGAAAVAIGAFGVWRGYRDQVAYWSRPGDRADDEAWAWERKLRADPHLRSAIREVEEWLRR